MSNGGAPPNTNTANAGGNQSISKTIAQVKLRKQRANRGASNPNSMNQQLDHNVSINGG